MNILVLKSNIFSIYDSARVLFNDYYNGFDHEYNEENIKNILELMNNIEQYIKEFKEYLI